VKNLALKLISAALFSVGAAHAAPPQMYIDFPSDGETVSGIITLVGWATGTPAVEELKLHVDGIDVAHVGYGGSRGDVAAAFPNVPGADRSGFGVALNTRAWSNGVHTLGIEVENIRHEKSYKEITVVFSNAPGDMMPTNVVIDLSNAKARIIDGGSLVLERALVDGVQRSLVLEMQPSTNHFVITSFGGRRYSDDRDGDGVPDDMDAFPDDSRETFDDNRNGIGDNDDFNGHRSPGPHDPFDDDGPLHDIGDDRGGDRVGGEPGDDHGGDRVGGEPGDDHGGRG